MSLLVVELPPRERLGARTGASDSRHAARLPSLWPHSYSGDGRAAGPMRSAAPGQLPKADEVVLVLANEDVSWHRLLIPKAAPARMAAALAGLMEEGLLDDDVQVHLALAPDAVPGQQGWVAATHRPRLEAALAALEAAGLVVDRVVTKLPPPGTSLRGHFSILGSSSAALDTERNEGEAQTDDTPPRTQSQVDDGAGMPQLQLSRSDGVWCLPLAGAGRQAASVVAATSGLAGALRSAWVEESNSAAMRWTSTPAAAWAAEHFVGRPVALQADAEHLLEAAQLVGKTSFNLRQFDLAPRHRGTRALAAAAKRLRSPEWRWVRYGLVSLLALQLLGLNAYAWQQQRQVETRRSAVVEILRSTHPGVRTVLDAPAQMASENARLRALAGRPGDADLELAVAAAAAAWPDGKGAVGQLRYEAHQLSLAAPGWAPAEVDNFKQRLAPSGWSVEYADGRLTLTRARAAAATAAGS